MSFPSLPPLEIWGGVECTMNRVGDAYFDQLARNGHLYRLDDLDRFAALGIRTLRYPIQWERIAPHGLEHADWSWADQRLERLRALGIRPIIGLVHHGSGPRTTSLVDAFFAEGLARFAHAVAERYPWIDSYTPVNEPLTTARFSGLYGLWYPHGRDDTTFMRALFNQCRAVALAMQAIRQVNPAAQLIQTDDLGKTFSTPLLAYQAEFENERRWLTFDLLCGRINASHSLWNYLQQHGIARQELEEFLEHPCPPDVLGINYYLTSERFLDENIARYPAEFHGGNGRHTYADVEAVRIPAELSLGHQARLAEAWERYNLPVAITEVHLNCTREEQLRWLQETWNAATSLRQEGVDVRAVTFWSLLGSYDWNILVTRMNGFYEPGVFDVRAPHPRPTAIAGILRTLAQGHEPEHPVLAASGWWRRPERFYHPPEHGGRKTPPLLTKNSNRRRVRPLLLTGATGTLGRAFAQLCNVRGLHYRLLSRQDMDITNAASIHAVLTELEPWAIVNTAGYVRVDDAEHEPERCHQENTLGPAILAAACAQRNIALLTFSSDLVFDGQRNTPYGESDKTAPLCVYGHTKAEAEVQVLQRHPSALVIRTSAFFGPWDTYNFVTLALQRLLAQDTVIAANDSVISPTYIPDLVHASLDLLIDGERGIWHLANGGATTWVDLARSAAELAGIETTGILGRPTSTLGLAASRPVYSVLGSERGLMLPSLEDALSRYIRECQHIAQVTPRIA